MKISIAILTAEKSVDRIRSIDSDMRRVCEPVYLPYSSTQHLARQYLDNAYKFDGFLFSGSFPCEYITNYVGAIQKPYGFFDVTDRDYYKLIAKIFVKYPGIDFSRVLIDQPTTRVEFEDVFDPPHMPLLLSSLTREEYSSHMDSLYEIGLNFYRKLWSEKRVDLIITRFSNLAGRLENEKIAFEILSPSRSSMLETVHQLVGRIQSVRLEDSVTAAGLLVFLRDLSEEECRTVEGALGTFNDRNNRSLVVRKTGGVFEISMSNKTLKDITHNYSECLLSEFLRDVMKIPFCVGWGTGNDPIEAQRNAARALKEGRRGKQNLPYIVTRGDEVIGPLSGTRSVVSADVSDERVERLGKKLGISAINMAKLMAVTEKMGRDRLSSNDLMHYLGITRRSAGRILTNLAEWGMASLIPDGGKNARGRPVKVYQVNFDKFRS